MILEKCLYQILDINAPKDNGNCEICSADEFNKFCINYCSIKILILNIKKDKKEQQWEEVIRDYDLIR